jgi:hypothetical protein
MKTIKIFFAITLLSFFTSNAQITEGNWMVGGNGLFSSNQEFFKKTNEKYNSQIVQVTPNIGYFVVDKLAIGTKLGYEGNFVSYTSGFNYNTISYGLFSRYYLLKPEKLANVFVEGAYLLEEQKYRGENYNVNKNNTYYFMTGLSVFFNSSVSIELMLKYATTLYKNQDSGIHRLQVGLGFQIFLENNK